MLLFVSKFLRSHQSANNFSKLSDLIASGQVSRRTLVDGLYKRNNE